MTWLERAVLAALIVVLAIFFIGMWSTWRECTSAGGTTVRGLLGLECIR